MDNNQTSNSSATLLGGYNFGFYENSTQLTGSHFKDPILVSAIVVNGICVVSFAVLAIVSWWMKGKRARGRRVFAVLYGLVVALFLFVSIYYTNAYGRTVADEIVHEYELYMLSAYLALPIVKQVLANETDTTLVYVVYSVIATRFRLAGTETNSYESVQDIQIGSFILKFLFGIADTGLFSYAQVYTLSVVAEETKAFNIANWYRKIHLSYITIYTAISLEMSVCAVFIFRRARPAQTRISKCLISKITRFLIIRSVSNLSLTIMYVYLGKYEQKSTGVIAAVLLGMTSAVIYTGLVVIGFDKEWDVKIDPSGLGNVDPNEVQNVFQQFDNAAKQFS